MADQIGAFCVHIKWNYLNQSAIEMGKKEICQIGAERRRQWFLICIEMEKCVCWCSTVHFSFFRPCFFPIHRSIVRIPCSSLCRCHIVFNFPNDATESLVWVDEYHFESRRWLHRVVQSRQYDTAEFRKRFFDCTYNVAEHIKSFCRSVLWYNVQLLSLFGYWDLAALFFSRQIGFGRDF